MSKVLFTEDMVHNDTEKRLLLNWNEWNPGLDNGDMLLGELCESLPAAPPSAIPEEVRSLENPDSPEAYPGAINLERHDCIHALIGRGLLPQDEAFVIGFTMGASKKVTKLQFETFRSLAVNWYPKPYNFSENDLFSFDLGFAKGTSSDATSLEHFPFERFMDLKLGDLRKRLGINTGQLRSAYRKEKLLLPDSAASRRLDIDVNGVDYSSIYLPTGKDV
jgi:hypothetical protein